MRLFRLLLLLLPSSFRAQYDREITALYARRFQNAANPFAIGFLWLEVVSDLCVTAAQTHWDILGQDLRYSVRGFRRAPGFAVTAIVVAALGVGATTAAYTITDNVLIRPLPFPEPERLVDLWEDMSPGNYKEMEPSPANYRDWKSMSKSFVGMAASTDISMGIATPGNPQQEDGALVTSDLFPMLGAHASIGRLFIRGDDLPGAASVVVLSTELWQERFGGETGIVGQRLLLNGQPYDVIGVMAPEFHYPTRSARFWVPLRLENDAFADRNDNYLHVIAKLRDGVTIGQARSEMRIVADRLRKRYPKDNEHVGVTIDSLRDEVPDRIRLMLFALLGASFCVLLIACANLAGLLLARAMTRRKEVAVRAALGAGPERLVRQMLTESLLLALCGGSLGVLLASLSVPLFSKLVPTALPVAANPSIDGRVLLLALGLTVLTGICFGIVPAVRVTSASAPADLREGSRQGVGGRKERVREALVIAEIAISCTLLIGCGLLIRALWQLEHIDPGFKARNVMTLRTALPWPKYAKTAIRVQFYTRILDGIRRLQGVDSAGYVTSLPIVWRGGIWPVNVAGHPTNADRAFHQASLRYVTPGYFEAMDIPLLRGRRVSDSDEEKSRYVAVVSQSFVNEYWPHQDPIGRQFNFALADRTVVGIAGDVRVRGMERSSEPQVYVPYTQVPDEYLIGYVPKDMAIRSSMTGEQLLPSVRRIVHEVDAQQPISNVRTMSQIVEDDTAPRRLQTRVLGGFALIAIFLAAIGVHGLLSFTVTNRLQEIGVRMAMGATSGNILSLVLRDSALLAGTGIVSGIGLGYGGGRLLNSLLAGIDPGDVATFAVSSGLVLTMTLAGSLLPALRAMRVDPICAIRAE